MKAIGTASIGCGLGIGLLLLIILINKRKQHPPTSGFTPGFTSGFTQGRVSPLLTPPQFLAYTLAHTLEPKMWKHILDNRPENFSEEQKREIIQEATNILNNQVR